MNRQPLTTAQGGEADAISVRDHQRSLFSERASVLRTTGGQRPGGRHTTSPAGSIVARVDAVRALPASHGPPLCARLLRAVAVQALREVMADGGRIACAADPMLAAFQVVVTG